MIQLEKFPELIFNNQRLVWDSRQPLGLSEKIFIRSKVSDEIRENLKARASAAKNSLALGSTQTPEGCGSVDYELGLNASLACGEPSKKLKIFGVTGTNGKTTTVQLLRHYLVSKGHKVLELGTLGLKVWDPKSKLPTLSLETGFTTPEAPVLHHLLKQAVENKISHVVMEVSSHSLSLGRVAGVHFTGAGFTNLSRDHLDFHGTMESYAAAKALFFSHYLKVSQNSLAAVLCKKGPQAQEVGRAADWLMNADTFTEKDLKFISLTLDGSEINFRDHKLKVPLLGTFNAENFLVAGLLMKNSAEAASLEEFSESIKDFAGVCGRLERVAKNLSSKIIFVDYAHTPDALEKTLSTLAAVRDAKQKLWCVFGCGGDRDPGKRPMMAAAAAKWADYVMLTSDNPRTEDPFKILADVQKGFSSDALSRCFKEVDRKKAIEEVLLKMGEGDICVVAGKGHEDYQIIGKTKFPFSDQRVIESFLKGAR